MIIERIKSKQAYIINDNIGVSYNTPIAASVNGITFVTENYYSNTTAHHKSDVIRRFNNNRFIEVKQEVINNLYTALTSSDYTAAAAIAAAAIQEEKEKDNLINYLKLNCNDRNAAYKGVNIYAARQQLKNPSYHKRKDFKNGNYKTTDSGYSNFQQVSDIYYRITTHYKKVRALSLPTGTAKASYHAKYIVTSRRCKVER